MYQPNKVNSKHARTPKQVAIRGDRVRWRAQDRPPNSGNRQGRGHARGAGHARRQSRSVAIASTGSQVVGAHACMHACSSSWRREAAWRPPGGAGPRRWYHARRRAPHLVPPPSTSPDFSMAPPIGRPPPPAPPASYARLACLRSIRYSLFSGFPLATAPVLAIATCRGRGASFLFLAHSAPVLLLCLVA